MLLFGKGQPSSKVFVISRLLESQNRLVVKGRLLIKLRDRDVWLEEGEFFIVPKGVEHMPVVNEEVLVLLLEPKTTLNTGNQVNERTVADLTQI